MDYILRVNSLYWASSSLTKQVKTKIIIWTLICLSHKYLLQVLNTLAKQGPILRMKKTNNKLYPMEDNKCNSIQCRPAETIMLSYSFSKRMLRHVLTVFLFYLSLRIHWIH